jgi:AcrR family transcriptional regulator
MENKDAAYWRILNAAVSLDLRFGHQRWTIAQLARSAKVARSLIYYYFGKSKMDILVHAVKLIGHEFAGGSEVRHKLWKEGRYADTLIASRHMIAQTPAMIPFYDLNRDKDNEVGKMIRAHEDAFKEKIKLFFPDLNTKQCEALFMIFVGVVFSSILDDESAVMAVEIALKGLGKTLNRG